MGVHANTRDHLWATYGVAYEKAQKGHCFCIENEWKNSALLESGTKTVPKKGTILWTINWCPKGTYLGATYFFESSEANLVSLIIIYNL